MSSTTAAELAEYEYQLEQITGALAVDPNNEELLTLKNELENLTQLTKAQLNTVADAAPTTSGKSSVIIDNDRKRKSDATESRKVGDSVLAKWITGDHQFYAAKITSITGNKLDPVYTVKFTEYNEVQTLHGHQLRTINEHKKRALESASAYAVAPSPVASPSLPSLKPGPATSSIPPPPPSTVNSSSAASKSKKSSVKEDLAKNASDWSSFAKSGPRTKNKVGKKRAIGESSMFRTDENGRVGVIGSGRAMTSDPGKRGRHIFQGDR